MLKAGRALLLLSGYIHDDGGQHRTVVEMTEAILGDKYSNLVRKFESMRRKRNDLTYESGVLMSISDSQKALSDAISLVQSILKEIELQNPQLELKLDL